MLSKPNYTKMINVNLIYKKGIPFRTTFFALMLTVMFGCKKNLDHDGEIGGFDHVPGTVVVHSPKASGVYRGTPSLVKLPNGYIVASNDVFGNDVAGKTDVFISVNNGATWEQISTIHGATSSGLFYHGTTLYLLGADNTNGENLVIRASNDEGRTWTSPSIVVSGPCHGSSTPVLFANGRIYKAYGVNETASNQRYMAGNKAYIVSAPQHADLLDPASWTQSDALAKPAWIDGTGWLEGNAVSGPDGKVKCILNLSSAEGIYAGYFSMASDQQIDVSSANKIQFWGGASKFNIKYDENTQRYWSLTNYVPAEFKEVGRLVRNTRNVLALTSSADLVNWEIKSIVLAHEIVDKVSFQYVDFIFDGNDILFVSRTSYRDNLGSAQNQLSSNFMTFHRIENYRTASTPGQWQHLLPNTGWNGELKDLDVSAGQGNTEDHPILIAHAGQLVRLAEEVYKGNSFAGQYFKMTNDIDLNGFNFMPIGWYIGESNNRPFSGHFDGAGFRILNLNIRANDHAFSSNGMFGYVNNGSIRNLGIAENSTIQIGATSGGIVSYSNNATISHSYNKGSVAGSIYAGGILGFGIGTNTINNSYNTGNVTLNESTGAQTSVGGIAGGMESGSLSYSYSAGSVASDNNQAGQGGLIGGIGDSGLLGPSVIHSFYLQNRVSPTFYVGTAVSETNLKSNHTLNTLNLEDDTWANDTQSQNSGFPVLKGME